MTGLDLNLGLTALSLKVELLQAIARNIGGGPEAQAGSATSAAANAPTGEDAPHARGEERPPVLSDVAADPQVRPASGTLVGLRQPAAEAMRRALAEEIARLMKPETLGPQPAAGFSEAASAEGADGRFVEDRGSAADGAGFESSLAAIFRRPVAHPGAPRPATTPADKPSATTVDEQPIAAAAGDLSSSPAADHPAIAARWTGPTAPRDLPLPADASAGLAREGADDSSISVRGELTREAAPAEQTAKPAGILAARTDAAVDATADGFEPTLASSPPIATSVAAPGIERAILEGAMGLPDLSAALAASLGDGIGPMSERGGVIASFILNAAMIPGWPPPRPIEPAALRAFVFSVVGEAKLTQDEAETLLYLANLGVRAKDLRRMMRRILAAKNRSVLMLALAAILTNARAAMTALADEIAALAEEMSEERRLAAADGRSRLLLR
ncbi:hypothetical protein [Antarcticirhabdus aurantiaca]|uniref:Uncharacterized protein n=1 Tax=Antarcticirhabdus aurantiaca TaxID=2606717 RepID=A0ACD4NUJ8_9HYPH|nr:hypothetical protein [Antarcticirhabdus aurantiaca]WAJ30501.1 hypothetical protein OXU80_09980 [Jeongeuplla avenae]